MSLGQAIAALAARERNVTADHRLGVLLAFIAGTINAAGFLAVGRYTSHMTGIVSSIADALVLHQFHAAALAVLFVASFIGGAGLCAVIVNTARARHYQSEFALVLILEALLLLLFGLAALELQPLSFTVLNGTICMLCFIMGLQNAIITKISHAEIRTTHVTGICTDIGIELGRFLYRRVSRHRIAIHPERLHFLSNLLGAFLGGALLGAYAFSAFGFLVVLPLALLLILVAIAPVWADLHPLERE